MTKIKRLWLTVIATGGVVSLILVCGLVLGSLLYYTHRRSLEGLNGQVCVGFTAIPQPRVGLAWYSPISSYYPSLINSPHILCVDVPHRWISILPKAAGELVFPP